MWGRGVGRQAADARFSKFCALAPGFAAFGRFGTPQDYSPVRHGFAQLSYLFCDCIRYRAGRELADRRSERGAISPLWAPVRAGTCIVSGSPSFSVVIGNLGCIAVVYSEGMAGRVLHEVWSRFEACLGSGPWVSEIEPWGISIRHLGIGSVCADLGAIEAAVHSVSLLPIEIGSVPVVVSLVLRSPDAADEPAVWPQIESAQYRSDMSVAALAYSALAHGEVNFAEQAIVRPGEDGTALYHECLVRLSDPDGCVIMPGAYLPELERRELTRTFDRCVVREIIAQLRRRPDAVLGCNISGLSVCNDIWWRSILEELEQEPELSRRLVIEITETARPPSTESALELVSALRNTGCRIALDDFGAGLSTIAFARAVGADIIKVDGSYIRQRNTEPDAEKLLHHLVTLAGDFATEVIVEGIESEADLQIARDAGANWFQGYFFKALSRPAPAPKPKRAVPAWMLKIERVLQ